MLKSVLSAAACTAALAYAAAAGATAIPYSETGTLWSDGVHEAPVRIGYLTPGIFSFPLNELAGPGVYDWRLTIDANALGPQTTVWIVDVLSYDLLNPDGSVNGGDEAYNGQTLLLNSPTVTSYSNGYGGSFTVAGTSFKYDNGVATERDKHYGWVVIDGLVNPDYAATPYSFAITADAPPAAVPEPATWAMVLLGFFGLGAATRSRRRGYTA